jgi:WD40 repeat protein
MCSNGRWPVRRTLTSAAFALLLTTVCLLGSNCSTQQSPNYNAGAEAPKQRNLAGHIGTINALAISPDNKTVVGGGSNGSVFAWSTDTGELLRTSPAGLGNISALLFSPDGASLLSATNVKQLSFGIGNNPGTGAVNIFDLASLQSTRSIQAGAGVSDLALSPDGNRLATAGQDGKVKIWQISGELVQTIDNSKSGPANFVRFSPDGKLLVIGSAGNRMLMKPSDANGDWVSLHFAGELTVWDASTAAKIKTLTADDVPGSHLLFSSSKPTAISFGGDDVIRVWDTQSWTVRLTLPGHKGGVNAVAFAPDDRSLASGGDDQAVRLWDIDTGSLKSELSGHQASVKAVVFSPNGRTLASAAGDEGVRLWQF